MGMLLERAQGADVHFLSFQEAKARQKGFELLHPDSQFGAVFDNSRLSIVRGRGLQLAGPLPDDIQNYTSYSAELTSNSESAKAFIRFLASPPARVIFVDAGIN